ncbi:MAG: hypothetical protein Q8R82_05830 [Hyphomonadaceae bacterium]|nr:hypothetical protein [Hyphomonadaceae bacterium]
MPNVKTKYLTYRRAIWFEPSQVGNNLAVLLTDVFKAKPKIADTRYASGSNHLDVRDKAPNGTVVHLHLSSYGVGEHASTVMKDYVQGNEKLGTAPPPVDADFLDNDAYVLVENSNVFICANGMHETTIAFYLQYLVSLISQPASNFSVERVPVKDKMEQLLSEGVKSIELDVADFDVHIDALNETAESPVQRTWRAVRGLIEKDRDKGELQDYAQIQSRIIYTYDGRIAGDTTKQIMTDMAFDLVEQGESGFVIVTTAGTQITAGDVAIRKAYRIERDGKSLDRTEAWGALDDFATGLKESGICAA